MKNQVYRYRKNIFFVILFILFGSTSLYSQDSDELFFKAKEHAKELNFTKALEFTKKASDLAPLDLDIREFLGKCYLELGEYQKARIILLDVLKKSPKRVDARHYLLKIETLTERYSSAICYANELLEITPYSKTLWQKKINLYNLMGNKVEANRATIRLFQIFPEDPEVRSMYNNVVQEDALKKLKSNDLVGAAQQYEKALEVNKNDQDLYLNLINTYLKMGNYTQALATADRGLFVLPFNKALIDKKIGILAEQNDYQKAIALTKQQLDRGYSEHYSQLMRYLKSEAAYYYKNTDPYSLYSEVYEQNKSDQEAFKYLLNTAMSRGYYSDAQDLLTQGLRSNPNSKELLSKQYTLYSIQQNRPKAGATIEKMFNLYPNDLDVIEAYNQWSFDKAKEAFQDRDFKLATPAFQRLLNFQEYNKYAKQYLFSIHLEQSNFIQAEIIVDELLTQYPLESEQVFRKVELLKATEQYSQAYQLVKDRYQINPDEYLPALRENSIQYIKYLNENENFEASKEVSEYFISADPNNKLAYNYAIGAYVSTGSYNQALEIANEALRLFPDDRDLRLKLSGIYSDKGDYENAILVLQALYTDYPHSSIVRESLIEQMFKQAKDFKRLSNYPKAKLIYEEILLIKPNDLDATIQLATILIDNDKKYYEALGVLNTSLKYNKDHHHLLYLKGVAFEKLQDYKNAKYFQSQFIPPADRIESHKAHLRYLDAMMLKNQFIISYLSVHADTLFRNTSVATLEYVRFEKKNTYVARVNYASRISGVGLQGEVDWYHKFENKSYFLANAGISNQYFPEKKVAFSYFKPIQNDWQVEFGGRYLILNEEDSLLSGIIGIEKSFNSVWVNARALLTSDGTDLYHSLMAQARFTLDNELDYVSVMASVGTVPEESKLDFQVNTLLSYVNTMVGGGYHRFVSHRTSIGLLGNWYNLRISEDYYVNQYNLYFTIRTKF